MLEDNLRRSISLEEMARHVNLTPEHLCRLFKAEMGGPPAKHLKSLRLQAAKSLLETTCLRVKEVMSAVGINDESHFVRDFEAAYGLPPAKYRTLLLSADLMQKSAAAHEIKNG
ncbi:MAG TPA: helix-turn-helix transcriptional regulator [Pyrinomonadaceae bacterium]